MLAGFFAFIGHLFPVWIGFKGGKGVATYMGILLGLFRPAALMFCLIWLATAVTTRYSSLSALVAAFVTPLFLWWFGHPGAGVAVRRADVAAVLEAQREHQAAAVGDRRDGSGRSSCVTHVADAWRPIRPPRPRGSGEFRISAGNPELLVQPPDHIDRQAAPAVHDLRDPRACADQGLQVPAAQDPAAPCGTRSPRLGPAESMG